MLEKVTFEMRLQAAYLAGQEAGQRIRNGGMIIRAFTVDIDLVGLDAVKATGCEFLGDETVVVAMPRAISPTGKIHFFQARPRALIGQLEAEFAKRGLVPVDPHTLCAFNAANPKFSHENFNITEWKDANGCVCHAIFRGWHPDNGDGRGVWIQRANTVQGRWDSCWWFAGISK